MQELRLDRLRLSANAYLSGEALRNLKVTQDHDPVLDLLIYRISTLVPAESVKEETHVLSVSTPADWFETLKDRFLPEILKKHFPVRMKEIRQEVTFTAYDIFPKLPKIYPEAGQYVRVITKNIKTWEESSTNARTY